VGPPPLLPFECSIKQEPNSMQAEARDDWRFGPEKVSIKEEQKDEEDAREKFNPDKLRSTFLWHVLQRHSSQQQHEQLRPEEAGFTEIDDRLRNRFYETSVSAKKFSSKCIS
jgi:hypothetical protein